METTHTFLLVEDEPNDAFFVERAFKRCPKHLQLRHVRDGVEAREYIQGENEFGHRDLFPMPDVVLLDLKVPRLNGFDFLQWIRNEAPLDARSIPVAVLTSSHEPSDVARAYKLGANTYFVKPSNVNVLVTTIQDLAASWSKRLSEPVGC